MTISTLIVLLGYLCAVGKCGGGSEGDPAPGRSPGPPSSSPRYENIPTFRSTTEDITESNSLTNQVGRGTPEVDLREDCPQLLLAGDDLIVVDKAKAAVVINVSHSLFNADVLTTGLSYQGKLANNSLFINS